MLHKNLMVVDIETVTVPEFKKDKGFPAPPFHQVVAIGFLEAEIEKSGGTETYYLKELRCGGETNFDEKQLLEGFFQYFERSKPRIVTYNGRSFDIPVLLQRAMILGVQAPYFYQAGDRWGNYSYRFSADWHCDLMEALTNFGAGKAVKLDEISKLMGFPGKFGIDGSKVGDFYQEGRIQEIRDYCETDVLNTYLVYLRYQYHKGEISAENYNRGISDVLSLLKSEHAGRPHLGEFLTAWNESCDGKFLFDE